MYLTDIKRAHKLKFGFLFIVGGNLFLSSDTQCTAVGKLLLEMSWILNNDKF